MPLFSNTNFQCKGLLHILPLRPQYKLKLREDVNGKIANYLKGEYMKFEIIVAYFLPDVY